MLEKWVKRNVGLEANNSLTDPLPPQKNLICFLVSAKFIDMCVCVSLCVVSIILGLKYSRLPHITSHSDPGLMGDNNYIPSQFNTEKR